MAYSPSSPRKTPQANPTDETHTFTTKLRGRPFDSAGEGRGTGSLYLFPIFCGRQWMQDYLFIFLETQAIIFIIRCLTAKIFILKIFGAFVISLSQITYWAVLNEKFLIVLRGDVPV